MTVTTRRAVPDDYDWIVDVVDDWWGRPVASALPRLFLDHFHSTSLVAEVSGEPVGFLVGLLSPSRPEAAYIHFVGIDPGMRGRSIGRDLYERFFAEARAAGRSEVSAVTSPVNAPSIAFHRRMGFAVSDPVEGYDGPGSARVTFRRQL